MCSNREIPAGAGGFFNLGSLPPCSPKTFSFTVSGVTLNFRAEWTPGPVTMTDLNPINLCEGTDKLQLSVSPSHNVYLWQVSEGGGTWQTIDLGVSTTPFGTFPNTPSSVSLSLEDIFGATDYQLSLIHILTLPTTSRV